MMNDMLVDHDIYVETPYVVASVSQLNLVFSSMLVWILVVMLTLLPAYDSACML